MLTAERKRLLLEILEREGRVVAKAVSVELGLSEDTIRRDLRELASEGRLTRVHGGALPASPGLADFSARRSIEQTGKQAVGRTAAAMIADGQVVVLDGGTTAIEVARHLRADLKATIVTHSPSTAVELTPYRDIEIILIGGRLFKHSIVTTGADAIEAIRRIRADLYFLGVTGIHHEAGLTTGDYDEAGIKRAWMAQVAETIALGSRDKIGTAAAHLVAPVTALAGIITDAPDDRAGLAAIEALGVTILRTNGD